MSAGTTVTLATTGFASAMAWAVRGRSSSVFGPSIWRGACGKHAIALTFDDGPTPGTLALLETLRQYRAPATFFQIGSKAQAFSEIARAAAADGHEIGNHSHTHPNFALARPSYIAAEFERAQDAIRTATAATPRFFRAPFGVRWFGMRPMQRHLGLTGAMWSVIGLDWKLPAAQIARRVLSRITGGDIICLHDGRGTLKDSNIEPTVEAVRRILPELLARGYHFETVSQLICPTK